MRRCIGRGGSTGVSGDRGKASDSREEKGVCTYGEGCDRILMRNRKRRKEETKGERLGIGLSGKWVWTWEDSGKGGKIVGNR